MAEDLIQKSQGLAQGRDVEPAGLMQMRDANAQNPDQTQDLIARSRGWYTGQNLQGTQSGFETEFYQKMFEQQQAAAENGTLRNFFEGKDATGIVTYDHGAMQADGTRRFRFGDVYEDGKFVGNVYERYTGPGEEGVADAVMAKVMLSSDQQRNAFQNGTLAEEIQNVRGQFESDYDAWETAQAHVDKVDARAAEYAQDGAAETATFLGGAAAGAALASPLAAAGPLGWIGVGVAGLAGGVTSWMNRDSIQRIAAEANVRAEAAEEAGQNSLAVMSQRLQGWGGVATQIASPLSNLVQGSYDVLNGGSGNADVAWNAVNDEGQRIRSGMWDAVGFGAGLGDGALQWLSPAGKAIYTTAMGSSIVGATGELVFSGGQSFDDRTGKFDKIYQDAQGDFDIVSLMAGVGAVTIDAAQLGAGHALSATSKGLSKATGINMRIGQGAGQEGIETVRLAGRTFKVDTQTGKAVSHRLNAQVVAPSEMVQAGSARIHAWTAAARDSAKTKGALTSDDLYRASYELTMGDSAWRKILVNGFGEAAEEGAQAILEPLSHNPENIAGAIWDAVKESKFNPLAAPTYIGAGLEAVNAAGIDIQQVGESFLAGGLMGAGMSIGTHYGFQNTTAAQRAAGMGPMTRIRPNNETILESRARVLKFERDAIPMTDKEWSKFWNPLSDAEKASYLIQDPVTQAISEQAAQEVVRQQQRNQVASIPGIVAFNDKARQELDAAGKDSQSLLDTTVRVNLFEQAEGTRPEAVYASIGRVGIFLQKAADGFKIHANTLKQRLEAATDPAAIAEIEAELEGVNEVLNMNQWLNAEVANRMKKFYDDGTSDNDREVLIEGGTLDNGKRVRGLNQFLQDAFDGKLNNGRTGSRVVNGKREWTYGPLSPGQKLSLQQAASLLMVRNPQQQVGSRHLMLPQVKLSMSLENANASIEVGNTALKTLGADFDGDNLMHTASEVMQLNTFRELRAGLNLLGGQTTVEATQVGETTFEGLEVVIAPQIHEAVTLRLWGEALNLDKNDAKRSNAEAAITHIRGWLVKELGEIIPRKKLHQLIDQLHSEIRRGVEKAPQRLVTKLFTEYGNAINHKGLQELKNMPAIVTNILRTGIQRFQRENAALEAANVSTDVPIATPLKQKDGYKQVGLRHAATLGQSLFVALPGTSIQRLFQGLNYTFEKAHTGDGTLSDPEVLQSILIDIYSEQNRGTVEMGSEDLEYRDTIGRRVANALKAAATELAEEAGIPANEALAVVSTVAVPDFENTREDGHVPNITLLQHLLRMAVNEDRTRQAAVLPIDETLRARHARLHSYTLPFEMVTDSKGRTRQREASFAGPAFVEVFAGTPFYDLLPEPMAAMLGANRTPMQWVKMYTALSDDAKAQTTAILRDSPFWGGNHVGDAPFTAANIRENSITAFRAVASMMLQEGNQRINTDKDGYTVGRVGTQNTNTRNTFRVALMGNLYEAMKQYAQVGRRALDLKDPEHIREFFNQNRAVGVAVMKMVNEAGFEAIYEVRTDENGVETLYTQDWVYEMLAAASEPAKAEMIYLRNKIRNEYRIALAKAGDKAVKYGDLNSRIQRLLFQIRSSRGGDLMIQEFWNDLDSAEDAKELERLINQRWRRQEAPYALWVDNPGEIDADVANAPGTASALSDLVRQAAEAAAATLQDIKSDLAAIEADEALMETLDAPENATKKANMELYLEAAKERLVYSHASTIATVVDGARSGFPANVHDKGKAASHVTALGQMLMNVLSSTYGTPVQQAMDAATAVNLKDIMSNPGMLANPIDFMDADFTPIRWPGLTLDTFREMWKTEANRPLLRAIFFPTTYATTQDGNIRQQMATETKSISELLEHKPNFDLFRESDDSDGNFLGAVEANARTVTDPNNPDILALPDSQRPAVDSFPLTRIASNIAIAHSSAGIRANSENDNQRANRRILKDLARILRMVGELGSKKEQRQVNDKSELEFVRQLLKEELLQDRIRQLLGRDATKEEFQLLRTMEAQTWRRFAVEQMQKASKEGKSEEDQIAIQQSLFLVADQLENQLNGNLVQDILDRYSLPEGVQLDRVIQGEIAYYLRQHPRIRSSVMWATDAMSRFYESDQEIPHSNDADLWHTLSQAVISHKIFSETTPADSTVGVPKYADASYAWDPTWLFLVDDLLREDSPVVQAAVKLWDESSQTTTGATYQDLKNLIRDTILDDKKFGEWTPQIPAAIAGANGWINSASGEAYIAAAGQHPPKDVSIVSATQYTFNPPPVDAISTIEIEYDQLFGDQSNLVGSVKTGVDANGLETYGIEVNIPGAAPMTVQQPLRMMNGRIASDVRLRWTDANGVQQEQSIWEGDLIDESDPSKGRYRPQVGIELPQFQEVHSLGMRAITVNNLRNAVRRLDVSNQSPTVIVDYVHPLSRPEGEYNNIFYDGYTLESNSVQGGSAQSSAVYAPHGENITAQDNALKSGKTGLQIKLLGERMSHTEKQAIESGFDTNLYDVLVKKANYLNTRNPGGESAAQDNFITSTFKMLMLKHVVRGFIPGTQTPVVWSAEKVMAEQAKNPGAPLPLDNAELVVIPDDHLRSFLGDTMFQGVPYQPSPMQFAPTVDAYVGWGETDATKLARIAPGLLSHTDGQWDTKDITDTLLTSVNPMGRARSTWQHESPYSLAQGMGIRRKAEETAARIEEQRSQAMDRRWIKNNINEYGESVAKILDVPGLKFDNVDGSPFQLSQGSSNVDILNQITFKELLKTLDLSRLNTIHVFKASSKDATPLRGILNRQRVDKLAQQKPEDADGFSVSMRDLVIFDLEPYASGTYTVAEQRKRALSDLRALTALQTPIVFSAPPGMGDLTAELREALQFDLGYTRVLGSSKIFQPQEVETEYAQMASFESSLMASVPITGSRMHINFLEEHTPDIEENSGIIFDDSVLSRANRKPNVLRTLTLGEFGLPQSADEIRTVEAVIESLLAGGIDDVLETMNDGVPKKNLLKKKDRLKRSEAIRVLTELRGRLGKGAPYSPGDPIRRGDLIPLVDTNNGRVVFHRLGYELMTQSQIDTKNQDVFFAPDVLTLDSTYEGIVQKVRSDRQYGYIIETDVPLDIEGGKVTYRGGGFKTVLKRPTKAYDKKFKLFGPNARGINVSMNAADRFSKEHFAGVVNNFRSAFALFGFDSMSHWIHALYPSLRTQQFKTQKERDTAYAQARSDVRALLRAVSRSSTKLAPAEIHKMIISDNRDQELGVYLASLDVVTELQGDFGGKTLLDVLIGRNGDPKDISPDAHVLRAAILYLTAQGSQLSAIEYTGGLINADSDSNSLQSLEMPALFTEYFDEMPIVTDNNVPSIRREIIEQFNQLIQGEMTQDFMVTHKMQSGKVMKGFVAYDEGDLVDENPAMLQQSTERSDRQSISMHMLATAYATMGSTLVNAQVDEKLQKRIETVLAQDTGQYSDFLQMAAAMKVDPDDARPWTAVNYASSRYKDEALADTVGYLNPLNTEKWDADEITFYEAERAKVAAAYGLPSRDAAVVDHWVRQHLGRSLSASDPSVGWITAEDARETLDVIMDNHAQGLLPTVGARVPLMHYNDLLKLYKSYKAGGRYSLKDMGDVGIEMKSFDDWAYVMFGQVMESDSEFNHMYLLPTDGMMHSYHRALNSMIGEPVSLDTFRQMELTTGDASELVMSIDPNTNSFITDPAMFSARTMDVDNLLGITQNRVDVEFGQAASATAEGRKSRAERRAAAKRNIREPEKMTMKNFREFGKNVIDDTSGSQTLLRVIDNVHTATTLLLPPLAVSQVFETIAMSTLDTATNLLMGNSSSNVGRLASQIGMSQRSPEDQQIIKSLIDYLAAMPEFKLKAFKDTAFQPELAEGAGRIERFTHWAARKAGRLQDPTFMQRPVALAQRYVEGIIEHYESQPLNTRVPLASLLGGFQKYGVHYLEQTDPQADQFGVNRIAAVRSLTRNAGAIILRGLYDPLSKNPRMLVSFPSKLFLYLPMKFSAYNINIATQLLGAQGFMAMAAAGLHGRRNPLFGRIQAFMAGSKYDPDGRIDMSQALMGIDLSREFVKGGITHTAILAGALLMGQLGMSGEDEEDKRRRRLAENQGTPYLYDPRKLQNDFRNRGMLFLDKIPLLSDIFQVGPDGKSPASMNWIIKQGLSPMLGIAKFLETGDTRQILWGYEDAINSFPIINESMWATAVNTFAELERTSKELEQTGQERDMFGSYQLLISAVATMESMLLENGFLTAIYQLMDRYDRDPYVMPERVGDGSLHRDAMGQPTETSALQSYRDENDEIKQGYVTRDWDEAALRSFTENRPVLALLATLTTGLAGQGWEGDYLRYQMPIKTREIDNTELTEAEAAEAALAAFAQQAAGQTYELSYIDFETGEEVLTETGAEAVFRGLWKGSVEAGSPSLEGVYVSRETREKILNKWISELDQEGVDMGLQEWAAKKRTSMIIYGDSTQENSVGLRDILFSDQIPYGRKSVYNQLNTTYTTGPDGLPMAVGVARGNMVEAFATAFGIRPLERLYRTEDSNLGPKGMDSALNTVDTISGINTGLRALERRDETWDIPTPEEIAEITRKAIEDSNKNPVKPSNDKDNEYGKKYKFGRRGGRGGGGGSSYSARMQTPVRGQTPYANDVYAPRGGNPIIRRATIRRERYSSSRDRLKQWQ